MPEHVLALAPTGAVRIAYEDATRFPAGDDVLAALCFGARAPDDDPRWTRVGLRPLDGAARAEVWRARGPVTRGTHGVVRFARDEALTFGVIELDEAAVGGIEAAAEQAYAAMLDVVRHGEHPHVLRIWNYFDAINQGTGDDERYRHFCVGRARGLGTARFPSFPAATAIGRVDGDPRLQVYWLAAREPGVALENPRQVSAFRYPRQYGPVSPSFSRAMLADARTLLISGTASVVGHESHHVGDVLAQLHETLRNLDSILAAARAHGGVTATQFGAHSALKVYLRHAEHTEAVCQALREQLPRGVDFIVIEGDICRHDLLIEIDGAHGAA